MTSDVQEREDVIIIYKNSGIVRIFTKQKFAVRNIN